MGKRVIAGLAVGACWLAGLLWAPGWVLFLVLIAMTVACQTEFYGMLRKGRLAVSCSPAWGVGMGIAWELFCFLFPFGHPFAVYGDLVLTSLIFLFFLRVLFMRGKAKPLEYAAVTLLGFFYLPFMLVYFIRLSQWGVTEMATISPDRTGVYLALFLAVIVKFNDVGGLAFGVPFGKHKLVPAISPKKSWEGFFGGMLFAVGFSVGLVALAKNWSLVPQGPLQRFTYPQAVALGVLLAVAGLLGDLVESRFKRLAEVKDSAVLLPGGMGGILDMFDSLTFVPVFLYFILRWLA